MLFHLLYEFRDIPGISVFRYPSFRIIIAMLTSLVVSAVLFPWFIRQLQRLQVGQVVREELVEHESKKNTPTMGGILLILAAVISTLLWSDLRNPLVWIAVGVTMVFATVGFIDDAMKLGDRGTKGLSERGKLLGQFGAAIAALLALAWWAPGGLDTHLFVPFVSVERFAPELNLWLYVPFAAFIMVGASNAVNLTDGLDGLAVGPVITSAGTFSILAYLSAAVFGVEVLVDGASHAAQFDVASYLRIAQVPGGQELAIFCAAIVGAGVGFLWYNTYPAQVFMGDVGALGLGGALGTVAVLTKNELLSAIILGIFVMEALSVLIQRYVYKITNKLGKPRRVFLMAPIHHHFQRRNWAEAQIVVRFWIIAIFLSLVALASLKLR